MHLGGGPGGVARAGQEEEDDEDDDERELRELADRIALAGGRRRSRRALKRHGTV